MNLGDSSLRAIRLLGEGTFGRVFLCQSCHGRKHCNVCVKRIIVQNPKTQMKMIMEEIYIVSQLKHPNIIDFFRSFVHAGTINIVMEYAANGTMRDVIHRNLDHRPVIPKSKFVQYFCDILMGLEYLHIRHVMHRDLKPENMLLDTRDHVKIADFGISAVHTTERQYTGQVGTAFYMAPEVLRGSKFDFKSDVWSLGCILYEMCAGHTPFRQVSNLTDLHYIISVMTRQRLNCQIIIACYGPIWGYICQQMLIYDVQKRISLPNILCLDASITIPFYKKYFDYKY